MWSAGPVAETQHCSDALYLLVPSSLHKSLQSIRAWLCYGSRCVPTSLSIPDSNLCSSVAETNTQAQSTNAHKAYDSNSSIRLLYRFDLFSLLFPSKAASACIIVIIHPELLISCPHSQSGCSTAQRRSKSVSAFFHHVDYDTIDT
ncbi:hypothetical protein RvY_02107-1 [Ramazzottius varieornatus]|uniref:Uncharacterized protein n=1 Tax=Ramazzottius varieornatus TaxID=947166 RepID=A0A1D1ULZ5_RAMVA|nr:hypothetical protein RvY_02107-1 [Ramazzottius varieornatus]